MRGDEIVRPCDRHSNETVTLRKHATKYKSMRKWMLECLQKIENRGIKISRVNSILITKSINLLLITFCKFCMYFLIILTCIPSVVYIPAVGQVTLTRCTSNKLGYRAGGLSGWHTLGGGFKSGPGSRLIRVIQVLQVHSHKTWHIYIYQPEIE